MIQLFYDSLFVISLLCAAVYIFMWHKHFDVNFTMIYTLVMVSCLGYVFYCRAVTQEESVLALKVIYIGGVFLQLFMLFCIFNLCGIMIKRRIRELLFGICVLMYASVLTIGYNGLFYRSAVFDIMNNVPVLLREYGPMHTVFNVVVCVFFLTGIGAIVYAWFRNKSVPRTVISLLVIPEIVCLVSFFGAKRLFHSVDLIPIAYVLADFIYLLIAYRVNLYDVSDTVIDSMMQQDTVGYMSFDFKFRYLGSDETAKQLIPELRDVGVDEVFGYRPAERKIRHFLNGFEKNPEDNTYVYTVHDPEGDQEKDRIYEVKVNYLFDGNRKRGYIVTFTDDTANKKYIRLLDSYNEKLKEEVEEKTAHIEEMHDNLIMSLAMMVESRDNSTGGHIKRTSEGVRVLVDEITKEGILPLSKEFCKDVIKAAPMHDLGKIAVDDAILRKPGRFTPEEFEKMKQHAAEGARVIHEILLHTDDNSFKKVAENVAHYHHERWDGSGYPEQLSGEEIPIEARIMAIADVYDALVSKRVYKDAYGFEKADSIIMEGMGTQFDPGLRTVYEHARPRLEEYYSNV